jgi:hypothetical protein
MYTYEDYEKCLLALVRLGYGIWSCESACNSLDLVDT